MSNESEKSEEKPVEAAQNGRKSIEETVISLRKELQVLYESLKEKNEQLMYLEEDVKFRDVSIKYLKNEYKDLKDSIEKTCSTCHKKVLIQSDSLKTHTESHPEDVLVKLQKDLKDREALIKELNKKIIRLSDNLIFVQKESLVKDDRIDELQRQMDKFRQVVRPFTKAVVKQRTSEDFFLEPGVENTRVISNEPSRLKRTAIRLTPSLGYR